MTTKSKIFRALISTPTGKGALLCFLFVVFILSAAGCSRDFSKENASFVNFGGEGLEPGREIVFYPFRNTRLDSIDTRYDVDLVVRYVDKCSLKSLPINVETSSCNADSISNRHFTIDLFDDSGNYSGKGNFGFYEKVVPLLEAKSYDEGMLIAVSTTEENTRGIVSLGVVCNQIPK